MDNEQIKELISQLKGVGLDDDKIMDVFYKTFTSGKMDREDLEVLAEHMGYELTDEFKKDSTPDPIAGGEGKEGGEGEITKDEAEAAKALEPGETASEFKDKIDEMKEEKPEEAKPEKEEGKEESEEEGWEKAQKMFKI